MIEIGDMIVEKEGCGIVTEISKVGNVTVEFNRKEDNKFVSHMKNVLLLIEMGRWKVQKVEK